MADDAFDAVASALRRKFSCTLSSQKGAFTTLMLFVFFFFFFLLIVRNDRRARSKNRFFHYGVEIKKKKKKILRLIEETITQVDPTMQYI